MKINFIVGGLFRSGGMRIIFEYANRLTRMGHDVALFYPIKAYDFYKKQSSLLDKVKNYYWRIKELNGYKNIKSDLYNYNFQIIGIPVINNYFLRNADCTIATQWPTAFDVNKLNEKKGSKFYFIQDYEKWNSNISLVNQSYKLPLNKITISKYLKDYFKKHFGVDSKVIYNGIDFNFFNNPHKEFLNSRKKILLIDHYLSKKGIKIGINILEKLKLKYSELDFISFGYKKYNYFPRYVDFIENPMDDKIKELYCESDILLFPSLDEGFGLPPAEAMACKCAVVSTRVGAIPEYSTHMESAILADPGKPEELFDGLCYLIDNNDELKRISLAGYYKVKEFFNWDNSVNLFEKVLLRKN